uniref:Alpha-mannosidase n=1 Tax=Trichobilharzia regenti TaxID=157069 RepID=A0AA85JFW0_TRIRE|nr:unnamed protein product [Trichobilharzia regenti]
MSKNCNSTISTQLLAMKFLTMVVLLTLMYTNQTDSISLSNLFSKNTSPLKCGYSSCPKDKPGHINVHLIPHTHDDVGWLKTVDQYYYGANNTIQRAGVQYILDSVIKALAHSPNRKFTYVEMAFFHQWWVLQSEEIQNLVKELVQSGQLQFALGGWSMADEATVYYGDAIDQLTLGRDVLKQLFGKCGLPLVAWQIDPFGHSRDHSDLLLESGYDGVYFQRIDYREKQKRREMKELEVLWDTAAFDNNLNNVSYGLFTGMFYDTYCYPQQFQYDDRYMADSIIDNPYVKGYNADRVAREFIDYVHMLKEKFKTNDIMILMGCDFTYENANMNFNNMDKLIAHVNKQQVKNSTVNVFYSTPACYTQAVNKEFHRLSTINRRGGDFFPYASGQHAYWTGYFTSRPALKYYVRQASNLLTMCEQIHLFANHIPEKLTDTESLEGEIEQLDLLRQALGVLQHHDAVSGTSKQHVADDYAWRLYNASQSCQALISDSYQKLLSNLQPYIKHNSDPIFCDLLNISLCTATEGNRPYVQQSKGNSGIFIFLYNPLSWQQSSEWIRFPLYLPQDNLPSNGIQIILKDLNEISEDLNVPYQLIPIGQRTANIPERKSKSHEANHELLFKPMMLPPLGFALFYFAINPIPSQTSSVLTSSTMPQNDNFSALKRSTMDLIYNDGDQCVQVVLKQLKNEIDVQIKLNIELMYYQGEADRSQRSGAYVFLPKAGSAIMKFDSVHGKVIDGPLVKEAYVTFSPWASLIVRLYNNGELEVEWTIGSLPLDSIGREVVIRYVIDGKDIQYSKAGEFFTDSSGRRLIRRIRDQRTDWKIPATYTEAERITSNYYPVVNRIMLKNILISPTDTNLKFGLAVYTDRSQGGTSLKDGELELMLHRQTVVDDGFGVEEALREKGLDNKGLIVRGVHRIKLDELELIESDDRKLAQIMRKPIIPLFIPSNKQISEGNFKSWSGITQRLPDHIHILSLTAWPLNKPTNRTENQLLVRLENVDENSQLSLIDVTKLFTGIRITDAQEMILTADQSKEEAVLHRLHWPTEPPKSNSYTQNYEKNATSVVLKLPPGKIITFILDYI